MTMLYLGGSVLGPFGNTWTFSGFNLGTVDAGRHIIVATGLNSYGFGSTVTVNGNAASALSQASYYGYVTQLWMAAVPTGATGDIVVTCIGGSYFCFIGAWWADPVVSYDQSPGVAPTGSVFGYLDDSGGNNGLHQPIRTTNGQFTVAAGYYLNGSGLISPIWDAALTKQEDVKYGSHGFSLAHIELTDGSTPTVGGSTFHYVGFNGEPYIVYSFKEAEGGPPGGGGGSSSWQNVSQFEWDNGQ